MLDVQKTAINRLLVALDGVKAQYKIILPDGTEWGALETKPVKVRKEGSKASPYPRGELKAYVEGFIATLPPGEATLVPYGSYEVCYLASACCTAANTLWGNKGSICARSEKNGGVEVLRLAK